MESAPRLLLFGATGAIGSAFAHRAVEAGWHVVGAARRDPPAGASDAVAWRRYDPLTEAAGDALAGEAAFDSVCWAQGANLSDSPGSFDATAHLALYEANVLVVLASLASLVAGGLLRQGGARLVVVSSIWQERARPGKLSYCVTKAAVGGLVRAASVDLASDGHLINAVLPGVLDTPMTRRHLSAAEIAAVEALTRHRRLPDLATLTETMLFLCSAANTAISGQSVTMDLGMSNAVVF